MAEPARRFDDPEPAGNADSAPPGRRELKQRERAGGNTEETGGGDFRYVSDRASRGGGLSAVADDEASLYKPSSPGNSKRGPFGWSRRRKVATGGGVVGIIATVIFAFFFSSASFELIHLKHVVTDDIGGTQARTYRIGRQKMYSTMFFFDQGQFNGYKATGIRRLMLENRKTNKMVKVLKKNGYEIKFDNQGRVTALNKLDENGNIVESYKSKDTLLRAWSIKDPEALPSILREVYPDKSDFWYNRAVAQLSRRGGLTRTNWLKEQLAEKSGLNAANRKIGAVEERFVSALRQKLFGTPQDRSSPTPGQIPDKTDQKDKDLQKQLVASNDRLQGELDKANQVRSQELADASANFTSAGEKALAGSGRNVTQAIEKSFSGTAVAEDVGSGVAEGFNVLNNVQRACTINSDLNTLEMAGRTLQAAQLIKFSYAILNQADVAQNGSGETSAQMALLMSYLNSRDNNGNTMFNSSGYKYWTDPASRASAFTGLDADQRDKYSVGGGFVGTLAGIRDFITRYTGGGKSCKHINNPFVTVAGFVIGGITAFFTAGSSVIVNTTVNISAGMIFSFANSLVVGHLVPVVAGTLVNGSEVGPAVGNAFISGSEALTNAVGANTGMRPLSTKEFQVAEASYEAEQKVETAQQPLIARLFSPALDHSLTTVAATSLSGFNLTKIAAAPAGLVHFVASFGGLFNHPALADSSSCPDKDVRQAGVAATPFCNVIVGIPDSVLNNPAYAPDQIDDLINARDKNVDDDGQPIPDSPYANYLKNCTADPSNADNGAGLDLIHNHPSDSNAYKLDTKTCSNDLFNVYRFYMIIAQSEHDALTDNLSAEGANAAPTQTAAASTTYQNPLRDIKNLTAMRIDEGVDYAGSGPIHPIGNAKIDYFHYPDGGWTSDHPGIFVSYTLTDGPAAGKSVYVAENCIPAKTWQVGDTVSASDTLCNLQNAYPNLETGWAPAGQAIALAKSVYHEGDATKFGRNFSDLLVSLGAPAGTYDHPAQKNNEVGTLPAGWPSWH
jgi:hypothetical protein